MKKIETNEEVNDLLHFLSQQKDVTIEEIVDAVWWQVVDIITRLEWIKPYSHNLRKDLWKT